MEHTPIVPIAQEPCPICGEVGCKSRRCRIVLDCPVCAGECTSDYCEVKVREGLA